MCFKKSCAKRASGLSPDFYMLQTAKMTETVGKLTFAAHSKESEMRGKAAVQIAALVGETD
ncbi:hypothetical protein AL073_00485 [Loktanella sp. 1ANDIMAR09]|nr:hypothetical protein AL073_00485 [Loktanella sp. 1ANDIMAR09]